MPATNQNFSLFVGDALTVEITVSEDGTPVNLTGFTVKWSTSRLDARGCFSATPVIEKCSNESTLFFVDILNGVIEFTLVDVDTESLSPGNYHHQLIIVDGTGNPTVVTIGTMVLTRRLNNTC